MEMKRSSLEVEAPTLPRARKVPRRFEIGDSVSNVETVIERYKRIIFETVDLVVGTIESRFNLKGCVMVQELENI